MSAIEWNGKTAISVGFLDAHTCTMHSRAIDRPTICYTDFNNWFRFFSARSNNKYATKLPSLSDPLLCGAPCSQRNRLCSSPKTLSKRLHARHDSCLISIMAKWLLWELRSVRLHCFIRNVHSTELTFKFNKIFHRSAVSWCAMRISARCGWSKDDRNIGVKQADTDKRAIIRTKISKSEMHE